MLHPVFHRALVGTGFIVAAFTVDIKDPGTGAAANNRLTFSEMASGGSVIGASLTAAAVVNLDALAPDGSASAVIAELDKYSKKKRIALVGHDPGVADLAARLAGIFASGQRR